MCWMPTELSDQQSATLRPRSCVTTQSCSTQQDPVQCAYIMTVRGERFQHFVGHLRSQQQVCRPLRRHLTHEMGGNNLHCGSRVRRSAAVLGCRTLLSQG